MPRSIVPWVLCMTALAGGMCIKAEGQDATALEAQYKTCAKHYIPAEKCTPEIYRQLKEKDEAPLDSNTAAALRAAKEYQTRLKNPASMQIHTAYVRPSLVLSIRARADGSTREDSSVPWTGIIGIRAESIAGIRAA